MQAVQEVALARDLDTLTTVVKHAARALSGADGVTFVLREAEHCFYVDEDAISPLWKGRRFPLDVCISGWSMTHREVVVIEDIYADPRIPHDAYRPTFVKSLAMIPVRARDPIAAIGAYWARPHRATARETELLQSLADTTAVALENVQLFQALRAEVDESSRLLEQFKREVSKREHIEEQLRQSQKMEAIGRLAGGVAHDFNNILTAIMSYSELVLQRVPHVDPIHADIEEIRKAGELAGSLTRQLLAFGRKQVLQPKALVLNDVVRSMDHLLRRVLAENIDVMAKLAPNLATVYADPGQLEQILMNLAINARDAMPDGGRLTIETENVTLDEAYTDQHQDTRPGPHVMLAVSDSGTGMDTETRNRIFDPFFTTKSKGKGTGLGLSTVYGIVKQSGGNIWVYSELGKGTTFKVYLPQAKEEAEATTTSAARPVLPKGTGTILVVEDETMIRRLVRRILQDAGYNVLLASDVDEAVRIYRQCAEPLDLLLTDVVLPSASGRELAEKLVAMQPELKVVYMSGYTDNAIVHHGMLGPRVAFIQKPMTPTGLLEKVRSVLGASSSSA